MPDKPYINSGNSAFNLRGYSDALIKTIKHIHGDEVKPIVAGDKTGFKAKSKPAVIQNKPDNATEDCYAIGFRDPDGLNPTLVNDVQQYAESISKEPQYSRIIYRGSAVIGDRVFVYFDKSPDPESAGLEKIAQQYKAARRGEFIQDIITAARAAGVEELLISHWPTQTS